MNDVLADLTADHRIEIHELTWSIFLRTLSPEAMTIPELHDRFIVSTALYL